MQYLENYIWVNNETFGAPFREQYCDLKCRKFAPEKFPVSRSLTKIHMKTVIQ